MSVERGHRSCICCCIPPCSWSATSVSTALLLPLGQLALRVRRTQLVLSHLPDGERFPCIRTYAIQAFPYSSNRTSLEVSQSPLFTRSNRHCVYIQYYMPHVVARHSTNPDEQFPSAAHPCRVPIFLWRHPAHLAQFLRWRAGAGLLGAATSA